MIRIFSILTGLAFAFVLALSFFDEAITTAKDGLPDTVEANFHEHPKHLALSSDGWLGKYDKQQLQRGFKVYQEVCSACHAIKQVAFRDLTALGYNEDEIKAIAAKATVSAKDPLTGEVKDRPGLAADRFPPVVYAALGTPPDLSLITKARHGGAAYVYSLLTGYEQMPAELKAKYKDFTVPTAENGLHYNPYFANLNLAMAPPLASDDLVTYADGTKATRDQMAKDVSAFLVWTAEPELDQRHQTGLWWLGFLIFATVLGYMAYRNIWAGKKH